MAKKIFILLLTVQVFLCKGQAIVIEEEFNGGTTAPTGWVFTSIGSTNSSSYGKSAPGIVMDATGDQVTSATFASGSANTLSFWAQSTTGTPTGSDLISAEYFNGTWNSCSPASFTYNSTARMFEATFPSTATRVRLTYTKSSVNAIIDDFTVLSKTGTCTANSFLWFSSIEYNSCNANTCEGTDEFITFQNGSSALNLSDLEITVPTSGNGPEGTTFCGNSSNPCDEYFTTNSTYVTALNGVTGCSGFFLSPPGGVIPANGRVILFMGNPPTSTINFGNLCSSGGNYYCVFASNSGTTNCQGRFSNSTSGAFRYTTIRNRSTGCSAERSYSTTSSAGNDGDLVAFDPAGVTTYISNPGCSGFVALPIELVSFTAEAEEGKIALEWEVEKEENTFGYTVEKSQDGDTWQTISSVRAYSAATVPLVYHSDDHHPINGVNYYRLKDIDNDGQFRTHKIISVNYLDKSSDLYFTQNTDDLIISCNPLLKNCIADLYDLSGRLVRRINLEESNSATVSKKELGTGLFLLRSENYPQAAPAKILVY